jgi:hypothetical protein
MLIIAVIQCLSSIPHCLAGDFPESVADFEQWHDLYTSSLLENAPLAQSALRHRNSESERRRLRATDPPNQAEYQSVDQPEFNWRYALYTLHNDLRSEIAQGAFYDSGSQRWKSARNMDTMVYSYALEATAMAFASKCQARHSDAVARENIKQTVLASSVADFEGYAQFSTLGENVAWTSMTDTTGLGFDSLQALVLSNWWTTRYQSLNTNYRSTSSVASTAVSAACDSSGTDFNDGVTSVCRAPTNMAYGRGRYIGCAVNQCPTLSFADGSSVTDASLIVCYYWQFQEYWDPQSYYFPIYKEITAPATQTACDSCPTDRDSCANNLCDSSCVAPAYYACTYDQAFCTNQVICSSTTACIKYCPNLCGKCNVALDRTPPATCVAHDVCACYRMGWRKASQMRDTPDQSSKTCPESYRLPTAFAEATDCMVTNDYTRMAQVINTPSGGSYFPYSLALGYPSMTECYCDWCPKNQPLCNTCGLDTNIQGHNGLKCGDRDQLFICMYEPPTGAPTTMPTTSPSMHPTTLTLPPTQLTTAPSKYPSFSPTAQPSSSPTMAPTDRTNSPSSTPTSATFSPTMSPSTQPTMMPTAETLAPTQIPSATPTFMTNAPSQTPTISLCFDRVIDNAQCQFYSGGANGPQNRFDLAGVPEVERTALACRELCVRERGLACVGFEVRSPTTNASICYYCATPSAVNATSDPPEESTAYIVNNCPTASPTMTPSTAPTMVTSMPTRSPLTTSQERYEVVLTSPDYSAICSSANVRRRRRALAFVREESRMTSFLMNDDEGVLKIGMSGSRVLGKGGLLKRMTRASYQWRMPNQWLQRTVLTLEVASVRALVSVDGSACDADDSLAVLTIEALYEDYDNDNAQSQSIILKIEENLQLTVDQDEAENERTLELAGKKPIIHLDSVLQNKRLVGLQVTVTSRETGDEEGCSLKYRDVFVGRPKRSDFESGESLSFLSDGQLSSLIPSLEIEMRVIDQNRY